MKYVPKNLKFTYRIYPPNSCCNSKEYSCEMISNDDVLFFCKGEQGDIIIQLFDGHTFLVVQINDKNMLDERIYAKTELPNISEYAEGYPVKFGYKLDRPTITAINEGGYNGTEVDLIELVSWIKQNLPEILE